MPLPRRFALVAVQLLLSAAILTPASSAIAENITYHLVNYPGSQADILVGGTDTISGTITTDGTLGTANIWNHILSVTNLSLTTSSAVQYTGPSVSRTISGSSGLTATSTALLYYPAHSGDFIEFDTSGTHDVSIAWNGPSPSVPSYGCSVVDTSSTLLAVFNDSTGSALPGQIGVNVPWIIATAVPEPTTGALLVSALLGLAGVGYLRRRMARA